MIQVGSQCPAFHSILQTGYLTIKGYDSEYNEYRLGFPNDEVKNGFLNFIYAYYVPVNPADDSTTTSQLAKALKAGDPYTFMKTLEALFTNTSNKLLSSPSTNGASIEV